MLNIAVFVSGGGTNLQALIDAQRDGALRSGRLALVVSNKEGVKALDRAASADIPFEVCLPKSFASREEHTQALLRILERYEIDVIVLAGYLSIITPELIRNYENRIINVHPSLIPSFCGPGCYGLKVHEMALAAGVKVTGATVHFVNEAVDGGAIIMQKAVAVERGDTPEILQRRVMEQAEWVILPYVTEQLCAGNVVVEDGRAFIVCK